MFRQMIELLDVIEIDTEPQCTAPRAENLVIKHAY